MKPYFPLLRLTYDPHDGPYPTRKSGYMGNNNRKALKRKSRSHKKGARQESYKLENNLE